MPPNVRAPVAVPRATASFVAKGAPIPVIRFDLELASLGYPEPKGWIVAGSIHARRLTASYFRTDG
jgi:hypothetical protein